MEKLVLKVKTLVGKVFSPIESISGISLAYCNNKTKFINKKEQFFTAGNFLDKRSAGKRSL